MKRRYMILLLFVCLSVFLTGQTVVAKKKTKVKVKSVTLTSSMGSSVSMARGCKHKLTTKVKVTPNKSKYKKVTYKSQDRTIARVTSKGTVYGIDVGKTIITVTSKKNKKKMASIVVNITEPITSIRLSEEEHTMKLSDTYKIVKTITPYSLECNKALTYTSSNESVAKVDAYGTVSAKGLGDAVITVKAQDGTGIENKCLIHVVGSDVVIHTSISSVILTSARCIQVTLNRPQKLEKDDFYVYDKCRGEGSFICSHDVYQVSTTDSISYRITLAQDFPYGRYLRVTIPDLDGTYMMDILARPLTDTVIMENTSAKQYELKYQTYVYGDCIYTVSGVMDGILYEEKNGVLLFDATQMIRDEQKVNVDVEDETGMKIRYVVTFSR